MFRWLFLTFSVALLAASSAKCAAISGRGFAIGLGRGTVWWVNWAPPAWTTDPSGIYTDFERWDSHWSFNIGPGGRLLLDTNGPRYHALPLRWMSIAMIAAAAWMLRKEAARLARFILRRQPGKCRKCRYELSGLPRRNGAVVCPECGRTN